MSPDFPLRSPEPIGLRCVSVGASIGALMLGAGKA